MKQKAKQQKRRLIPGRAGNRKRVSGKTGLPPGTLVHIGEIFQEETTVYLSTFTPDEYHRRKTNPVEIPEQLKTGGVCWYEVYGLHQVDVISDLGQALEISPMILEDVLNTGHRPKIDIRDKHIFMTLKHFHLTESREITMEQVSLVLGRGYLVSFQETTSPLFDEIRKRLQTGSGIR